MVSRWAITLAAVVLVTATFSLPARAQERLAPLINVASLKKTLQKQDVQILDIRPPKALMPLYSFSAGHIPGARNVPLAKWREVWSDPIALPRDADLTALIRSAGLTKEQPVVIVHSSAAKGNFGSAAWVYWVLKSSGFTDLAILDGGIRAWSREGLKLERGRRIILQSQENATLNTTWLATHADVDAVLDGTSSAQLLDARPLHQIAKDASLPGSSWLDSGELLNGTEGEAGNQLEIFERIKFADVMWASEDTITYCNNGMLAAVDWFMASEIAGIPNVRLYGHSLKARKATRASN